jgi:hypothetical protein
VATAASRCSVISRSVSFYHVSFLSHLIPFLIFVTLSFTQVLSNPLPIKPNTALLSLSTALLSLRMIYQIVEPSGNWVCQVPDSPPVARCVTIVTFVISLLPAADGVRKDGTEHYQSIQAERSVKLVIFQEFCS